MRRTHRILAALMAALMLCAVLAGCEKTPKVEVTLPDKTGAAVESSIYVAKIDGLSESFVMGADISSIISLEDSGVKFYDWTG